MMDYHNSTLFVIVCTLALVNGQFLISLNTTLNGVVQVSKALTKKSGLTKSEKQAVLNMHNALRNYIARGFEQDAYGGPAPSASNMLAMEWDDRLAEYAQEWANSCPDGHSDLNNLNGKIPGLKRATFSENLSGEFGAIERDMYGEIKNFNPFTQECRPDHQCGHYVTLASWSHFRLGCGWIVCKENDYTKMAMVCLFAPLSTGGQEVQGKRKWFQYEYTHGTPCSECPQGWNYCLEGGLCATKKQCESDSSNKCVCLTKREECEKNGGKFDDTECACQCPPSKYGLNCKHKCENTEDMFCGITCGESVRELYLCPESCRGCGKATSPVYELFMKQYPTANADNIKTTANIPKFFVAANPDMTHLTSYGKCKNIESDHFCETLRIRGYCKDSVFSDQWQYFCQLSCNSCGSTAWKKQIEKLRQEYLKKLARESGKKGSNKKKVDKVGYIDGEERTITDGRSSAVNLKTTRFGAFALFSVAFLISLFFSL